MFELFIALRYLFTKKKERFISIINIFALSGIALGVATLIIVMSVMNGYESELIKRIVGIKGHLTITGISNSISDYDKLGRSLKELEGVTFMAPVVEGQAMVTSNNQVSGAIIRGMNGDDLSNKPIMKNALVFGSWDDFSLNKGVIVGSVLANQLGINVGEQIKIIAPNTNSTIIGSVPRMKTFDVVGIFDVGMYEYNASTIFMPINLAQLLFQNYFEISYFELMVSRLKELSEIKELLITNLGSGFVVTDWEMANEAFIQGLRIERNVMFLILSLIIIIAAFNIISSLMVLVKDKSKGIAILRTIGASRASVVKIFVIYGFLIGFIGTVIGSVLGVLFTLNIESIRKFLEKITGVTIFDPVIYFLTSLPAELGMLQVSYIIVMSLILSFIATIYPAFKIATISPIETLRNE